MDENPIAMWPGIEENLPGLVPGMTQCKVRSITADPTWHVVMEVFGAFRITELHAVLNKFLPRTKFSITHRLGVP